jgi:alpha/beta superfamily hydrolase
MAEPLRTEKSLIAGPNGEGSIEIALHQPSTPPRAIAIVAHPHPLFGGTMDNKVVTTISRAFFDAGVATTRFNFRGVGQSSGMHDDGRGESEDMLTVIAHARDAFPTLPLWLAGFSFGAAVALATSESQPPAGMVLIAPAFARMSHWQSVLSGGQPPADTLLIHGENDETVPLADSLDWARTRDIPIALVPGADHFFHLRLHIVKALVARHLAAAL